MMELAVRITAADIDLAELNSVRDGLGEIIGLAGDAPFRDLRDDHPAVEAWDALLDGVIDELTPKVEALVLEAIHRRLPFEWELER